MNKLTSVAIASVFVVLLLWYQNINLRQANLSVNIKPTPVAIIPTPFVDPINLFSLVQKYREDHGLTAYTKSDFLCQVASTRLPEIKTNWSHEGFSSKRFCSGNCYLGENLARQEGSDSATLNAWLQSPEHKENLDAPYTHSCLVSDGMYTVQEFGYY
jgi:cysteine-rich secretory family protein